MNEIEVSSNGIVSSKKGTNTRIPYEHQKNAMRCLDIMNENDSYSTLVVLPTGGGKTYTASMWLLKNALDKKKKVLWLAHRQMLLDQALESFQKYAYVEVMPHVSSFTYRIVSGAASHDRTIDIKPTDNFLVVGKDSIGRNLEKLDDWIKGEDEIFLIIDEAHHSTAKTYRKTIDYIKGKVKHVKLIGLTATPFRTADSEKGLLAKIYTDGIKNGIVQKGDIGITYEIDLKELINRQILSKPIFESCFTEESYGTSMGIYEWEHIQQLDIIPDDIAKQMAESAGRNKLIVETYKKNQNTYEQTIVFSVNITHAIVLSKLFNKAGIKADYIVSEIKDKVTGVTISREENEKKLEAYRAGKLQVLVNVNILTEGVDLPQTKTVFLARPTVSTILMTQMIGRALRGTAAGGTASAYIVSFIDNWDEHLAWINPESIFGFGESDFIDSKSEKEKKEVSMIAISKIEEFASILDETVDSSAIEKVSFEKRIPLGMYAFSYLEQNGMDHTYQVMVYDSTQAAYKELMDAIPQLFTQMEIVEEYPSNEIIDQMATMCEETIFSGEMIPTFDSRDIVNILKYYAVYESVPTFYSFEDIDRNKLDVKKIAQHIYDEDMGQRKKQEYINKLWDETDDNILKLFFGRKLYFTKQLDLELYKISDPEWEESEKNIKLGMKSLEDLPLYEIKKNDPKYEKELRDNAFEKAKDDDGNYVCTICQRKSLNRIVFQVDHIIPMNKGGKSVSGNLQILCRKCNGEKGDQI